MTTPVPVLTVHRLAFANLMVGTMVGTAVVEYVFAWPGCFQAIPDS